MSIRRWLDDAHLSAVSFAYIFARRAAIDDFAQTCINNTSVPLNAIRSAKLNRSRLRVSGPPSLISFSTFSAMYPFLASLSIDLAVWFALFLRVVFDVSCVTL